MEAAQAALDRIDEIEDEERAAESQLKRLRDLYRARFRMCQAVLGGEDPETAAREQRLADYGELRRELIGVEREDPARACAATDACATRRCARSSATSTSRRRGSGPERAVVLCHASGQRTTSGWQAKNSRARSATRSGRLVGDEVAAAVDELDLHVVGVALVAGEHLRAQGGVVGRRRAAGSAPSGAASA